MEGVRRYAEESLWFGEVYGRQVYGVGCRVGGLGLRVLGLGFKV